MIGLAKDHLNALRFALGCQTRFNISQSFAAIGLGLACAEQIEIGAVEDMDLFHEAICFRDANGS